MRMKSHFFVFTLMQLLLLLTIQICLLTGLLQGIDNSYHFKVPQKPFFSNKKFLDYFEYWREVYVSYYWIIFSQLNC